MTAPEMTDALVPINDRLARAARAQGFSETMFFCECGNCLAEEVRLSLDEHEEIRAREDFIFAPEHDPQKDYRSVKPGGVARDILTRSIVRFAEREELVL